MSPLDPVMVAEKLATIARVARALTEGRAASISDKDLEMAGWFMLGALNGLGGLMNPLDELERRGGVQ